MKRSFKCFLIAISAGILCCLIIGSPSAASAAKMDKSARQFTGAGKASDGTVEGKVKKPSAAFDVSKMGDMSDFDPANPIIPTGDTIKIAIVAAFSGPASLNGQTYWVPVLWAVHDINQRGGIWVDGKKKLIEVIKADHMSKVDQCKKITEKMALQEKVHVFWGTDGTHYQKVINETANTYKIISVSAASIGDEIMDATNFNRYSFQSSFSTEQIGRGLAYYYGQIRKKEKKFYILNQDYSMGHSHAEGFKKGLKEYYPEAQLVGEDYHKLFLTDFAPYLTKIKASGAEVIYTGDWHPDGSNLLKQSRQLGIKLPFANNFLAEPTMLHEAGVEGSRGLVTIDQHHNAPPNFKTPAQIKFYRTWNNLWKTKWNKAPYNSRLFEHGHGNIGSYMMQTYWLLSVIERAQSTDPEKIIRVWEGDTYRTNEGKIIKMRACDHKAIQNLLVSDFVPPEEQKVSFNIPPYYWYKGCSNMGTGFVIPAAKVLPWMDQKLDRCNGKNGWGE